jgi:sugar lactone lactonase YvrE
MYWTDFGTDKIQRANLDGTGVVDLVTAGLITPSGIALDVSGGKMYWTDGGIFSPGDEDGRIQRANLDGTVVEDLVTGLVNPFGIALDKTGGILAQITPGAPCLTGNGRGMAFDGTDLYYTIVGDPNIYKVDTAGNCLGTIPVHQSQGEIQSGPLAWDGSALWTMNYATGSFTLYRVNPADGSIISSCNIAAQNPAHPAVDPDSSNVGFYPDGLDWTGSTLWVSSEAIAGNWVVEVDTNCNILAAFNPVPKGGNGSSGVAFDGDDLWHAYIFGSMPIVQTDVTGTETGVFFPGVANHEDLACDGVTFAPKAALWANEATFPSNRLTAYEIPRCAKGIGPPNQPPIAKCQSVEATADGQCLADVSVDDGSFDPDGDPITPTQAPPGPYGWGVTVVTLTVQDDKGASDSCQAKVKVLDATPPSIRCNAPAFITPRDVPVSFTARADDNCSGADIQITEYQCWFRNRAGRFVKRDCVVTIADDTITIEDSGGVGDNIDWLVTAVDDSGNEASRWCQLDVRRPRFPHLP